jgi:hypothetical protein
VSAGGDVSRARQVTIGGMDLKRAMAINVRRERQANRTQIDAMVEQRSRWWIPKTIDRRIAAAIVDGTIDILHRLRQRNSEVRVQFRTGVASLVDNLMRTTVSETKSSA